MNSILSDLVKGEIIPAPAWSAQTIPQRDILLVSSIVRIPMKDINSKRTADIVASMTVDRIIDCCIRVRTDGFRIYINC